MSTADGGDVAYWTDYLTGKRSDCKQCSVLDGLLGVLHTTARNPIALGAAPSERSSRCDRLQREVFPSVPVFEPNGSVGSLAARSPERAKRRRFSRRFFRASGPGRLRFTERPLAPASSFGRADRPAAPGTGFLRSNRCGNRACPPGAAVRERRDADGRTHCSARPK